MVLDHWSNDAMVSMDRRGLYDDFEYYDKWYGSVDYDYEIVGDAEKDCNDGDDKTYNDDKEDDDYRATG